MNFRLFEDAGYERILRFLTVMDHEFFPPLHTRADLNEYARELATHGRNFFLVADGEDIAHAGFYCNDVESGVAFVSSVAVLPQCQGSEAAGYLLTRIADACRARHMTALSLEVDNGNTRAIRFYEKQGFRFVSDRVMQKDIVGALCSGRAE